MTEPNAVHDASPGVAERGAAPSPAPPTFKPIPRWAIVLGIPAMVLVTVAVMWLLLGFGVDSGKLDAIRTGGTLGVGLGGVVVLWLAVRRQRSTELDLLQKYDTHALAERNAADVRADATERRITELYIRAVEQVGSATAPVRLGGLYALERLAQNNEDQRQTIVNVLCGYLRMPYALPADTLVDDIDPDAQHTYEQRLQEREVRLTAQGILETHLHPGPNPAQPADTFWSAINLDLTAATLINLNLADCNIHMAILLEAQFIGDAIFTRAKFTERAHFDWAQFNGPVWFGEAQFTKRVQFTGASFIGSAEFDGARFTGSAWFNDARFNGNAQFDRAQFTTTARFEGAQFRENAWFNDAEFTGDTRFDGTKFDGGVPSRLAALLPPDDNDGQADRTPGT